MSLINNVKENLKLYPKNIWFISLTILIPSLYGLLNRYFIGYMNMDSILVEQSFEALEVLMEVFLEMIPFVVIAVASQNYTKKEEVRKIVRNSAIFQLIITIAFTIISILGAKYFIDFVGTPESSRDIALVYFRMKSFILPLQSLWMIFAIGIKSVNPKKAISLSIYNIVINYLIDCILISNFSFSLKLGLMGAALSGIIANGTTLIISFIIFKNSVGLGEKFFTGKPDGISISKIFNIGKYTGAESLVRNIGYIIGVVAVVNLIDNNNSIVAYNTVGSIYWSIVLVPILALTEGTKYAIGNAYGELKLYKAKDILKTTVFLLVSWMLFVIVVGQFTVPFIASWLNNTVLSQELISEVTTSFNILWIAYVFFILTSILNSYFYGIGNPKPILLVSVVVNIVIYIPLGLLCKYEVISISYLAMLIVTVVIYAINTLVTYLLYKKNIVSDLKKSTDLNPV